MLEGEEQSIMKKLTIQEINKVQFSLFEGNPVIKRHGLSPVVADPSVVTPDESHDGRWHLVCHSIFAIEQYVSDDGYCWEYAGRIAKRAMRADINRIDGEYYIYYEHLQPFLKKIKGLVFGGWVSDIRLIKSRDLVSFSKPVPVLDNSMDYATDERGTEISNPFLLRFEGKYRMYFSAGQVYLEDCGFCEPKYISIAESESPDGPFTARILPIIAPDKNERWRNMCSGCIKVYRVKDGYIGIQNGIYKDENGDSHSATVLLSSENGTDFKYVRDLLAPQICPESSNSTWMRQFVYASSLSYYDGKLWLFFNARNTADMLRGREHIGLYSAEL